MDFIIAIKLIGGIFGFLAIPFVVPSLPKIAGYEKQHTSNIQTKGLNW
jgi:hypothetical protein